MKQVYEHLSESLNPKLNQYGQWVGKDVTDFAPCTWLDETPIIGSTCRLEIFDPILHAQKLYQAFTPDDAPDAHSLWTYIPHDGFASPQALTQHMAQKQTAKLYQTFVIMDLNDQALGQALGMASYMRHDFDNGIVEIGFIAFSPALQRSTLATEAMYLMMKRAFDSGYRRYEWKCDQLNIPSNKAALRLGFSFEGVFRNALIYKGRRRDTAWYSIICDDWPKVSQRFEKWLSPDNFDENGQQLTALSNIMP